MVSALALLPALVALAQAAEPEKEPAATKTPPAAEQAVRKVAMSFGEAFNSHSADKVADLWTADAEYIDEDGQRYTGRDTIKKEHAEFFGANLRAKMRSVIDSVRIVNGTMAVEDGRAMIEPPAVGGYHPNEGADGAVGAYHPGAAYGAAAYGGAAYGAAVNNAAVYNGTIASDEGLPQPIVNQPYPAAPVVGGVAVPGAFGAAGFRGGAEGFRGGEAGGAERFGGGFRGGMRY
jgi:uncharacterized protein (TIGR02246 family)